MWEFTSLLNQDQKYFLHSDSAAFNAQSCWLFLTTKRHLMKNQRKVKNLKSSRRNLGNLLRVASLRITCSLTGVPLAFQEMLDIMKAIYDMMGKCTYPVLKEDAPRQHVETFFQVGLQKEVREKQGEKLRGNLFVFKVS